MTCYLKHLPKFALFAVILCPAHATELVHRFESPSFGGNPLNGSFLLNQADQQNNFKDPSQQAKTSRPITKAQSNLQKFKDRLEQSVLSKLSQTAVAELFDANGNPIIGEHQVGDFTITISDSGNNAFTIFITDGITDTTLTIPKTSAN